MSSLTFGKGDFASLSSDQQAKILNGPAMRPPPNVEPNFDNPSNGNVATQVVLTLCLVLITIPLCGRLWIRAYFKQLFIGDYLLVVTYAINAVYLAMGYRTTISPGAFIHQWDIRVSEITSILYITFIMSHTYMFSIALIKVTILLEWIRIFVPRGTRNGIFWASYVLIWINIAACIITAIVYNMACTPHDYLWNKLIDGTCPHINTDHGNIALSAFTLLTDFLVLLIPQQTIWKLKMSTKKKIGVSITFAVGVIGIVVALIRLVVIIERGPEADFTYNASGMMLCSAAEITCAFLVVCIPALPKAFTARNTSKPTLGSESRSSRDVPQGLNRTIKNTWRRLRYSQSKPNQNFMVIEEHRLCPFSRSRPTTPADRSIPGRLESGILRTTHFEAKIDYDPTAAKGGYTHQYVINGPI
ncbi:hypothetical protein F4776DRAFT_16588 [Hypoxylon sp. NC0597]|nr:hypothetical protein F4776DRAFT_16588 [Hypoxylon sp. NC0597]